MFLSGSFIYINTIERISSGDTETIPANEVTNAKEIPQGDGKFIITGKIEVICTRTRIKSHGWPLELLRAEERGIPRSVVVPFPRRQHGYDVFSKLRMVTFISDVNVQPSYSYSLKGFATNLFVFVLLFVFVVISMSRLDKRRASVPAQAGGSGGPVSEERTKDA